MKFRDNGKGKYRNKTCDLKKIILDTRFSEFYAIFCCFFYVVNKFFDPADSPVLNHPSAVNSLAVSSRLFQYSRNTESPLTSRFPFGGPLVLVTSRLLFESPCTRICVSLLWASRFVILTCTPGKGVPTVPARNRRFEDIRIRSFEKVPVGCSSKTHPEYVHPRGDSRAPYPFPSFRISPTNDVPLSLPICRILAWEVATNHWPWVWN